MSRADQPQFKNITLPDLVSLPETCPKQSELDRFVQQLRQYDRSLKEMQHQINHNIANIDPLTNAVKTEVVTDQHKVSLTHGGTIKINAKHMAADPQVVRRNENNQLSGQQQSKESPNLKSSSIVPLVKNKISTAEVTATSEKSIFNDEDSSFIITEGDYSMVKAPQNQIPMQTFMGYAEQFLRPLTYDDLESLSTEPDLTSFACPTLGQYFTVQFKEENNRQQTLIEDGVTNPNVATNREYAETEDIVIEGDIKLGQLNERFLSCFVPVPVSEVVKPDSLSSSTAVDSECKFIPHNRTSSTLGTVLSDLTNRIHIGLYPEDTEIKKETGGNNEHTDLDEIQSTLIDLQDQLRNVIKINNRRKALLKSVCERHFGYQEYKQILHTVNKNIEHNYKTRYKPLLKSKSSSSKNKKKDGSGSSSHNVYSAHFVNGNPSVPESLMHLIETRRKLIEQVDCIELPTCSIYNEIDSEE